MRSYSSLQRPEEASPERTVIPTGLIVKPTLEIADQTAQRPTCFLVNCLKGLGKKEIFSFVSGASQVSFGSSLENSLRRLGIMAPNNS